MDHLQQANGKFIDTSLDYVSPGGGAHTLTVLLDSWADACIISQEVAQQLDLGLDPLLVLVLDGHCQGGHCLGFITN